jgi:manganese oxidase
VTFRSRLATLVALLPGLVGCSASEPVAPTISTATAAAVVPATRTYYIAADAALWDYAPSGINEIFNRPFEGDELVFTQHGRTSIGTKYRKALYREYMSASFSSLKPVPPNWAHLGVLGPLIRAAVGDTIKVVFRNNLEFPASIHPHGVLYDKASEGTPYNDGKGSANLPGNSVAPGKTVTYTWLVPERAGPGPADGNTVLWMYHSHVDEVRDVYAGLMGPIIISDRKTALSDGSSSAYDREFITDFEIFDENNSPYIDYNIAHFTDKPNQVDPEDEEFVESNLKHSINGYIYGNLPLSTMVMKKGQKVRWYVMAMGTEVDLHTPHWHGVTVLNMGMRTDVVELLPASMKAVDLTADNPGVWLFHCHVADHITAGMMSRFQIDP